MIVNRVGPLSCAKIVGLLYAIIGLVMGGAISLIAGILGFVPGRRGEGSIFPSRWRASCPDSPSPSSPMASSLAIGTYSR